MLILTFYPFPGHCILNAPTKHKPRLDRWHDNHTNIGPAYLIKQTD